MKDFIERFYCAALTVSRSEEIIVVKSQALYIVCRNHARSTVHPHSETGVR